MGQNVVNSAKAMLFAGAQFDTDRSVSVDGSCSQFTPVAGSQAISSHQQILFSGFECRIGERSNDVVVFVNGFLGLGVDNCWVSGRRRLWARMPLLANVIGKITHGKNLTDKSYDL